MERKPKQVLKLLINLKTMETQEDIKTVVEILKAQPQTERLIRIIKSLESIDFNEEQF